MSMTTLTLSNAASSFSPKLILLDDLTSIEILTKNELSYIKSEDFNELGAIVSEEVNGQVTLSSDSFEIDINSSEQTAHFQGILNGLRFPAGFSSMTTYIDRGKVWLPLKEVSGYLGYSIRQLDSVPHYRLTNGFEKLSDQQLLIKLNVDFSSAKGSSANANAAKKTSAPITPTKPTSARLNKVVYLTFDDGPTASTDVILKLLKKYNMQATFFMLNNGISKNPKMIKQMIEEGHALGLHGVTHRANLFYKNATSPLNEMNQANKTLEKAVGSRTRLIRTPYGSRPKLTNIQYQNLIKANYILWDWNVDSQDSAKAYVDPDTIVKMTISGIKNKDRPIVLLHDKRCTSEALESILIWMKENNYTSEAIELETPVLNWFQ